MTYLLDTNVLSETRRRQPAAGVAGWIAATPPDRLHVSVLTLGEIEQGIAKVRGRGDRHQASALERWLRDVEAGLKTGSSRSPSRSPLPGAVSRRAAPPGDRRAHRGDGAGARHDRGDPQRQGLRTGRNPVLDPFLSKPSERKSCGVCRARILLNRGRPSPGLAARGPHVQAVKYSYYLYRLKAT